jgi:hypothetical protein
MTFTPPPGFGSPQSLVFAGTLISTKAQNDASSIQDLPGNDGLLELVTADPIFPDMFDAQLNTDYGMLNNLEFLTSDLTQFGDAGIQLEDAYQQLVADLQAANPGVTFIVPPIVVPFIGQKTYDLFGGTFPNAPSPGTTTIVTGTAEVDFYTFDLTVTLPVDHFLCHHVRRASNSPKFAERTVTLVDQFGSASYEVEKPQTLCNPTDKNGEGILDPDTHLVGYKITPQHFVRQTNLLVTNQFHPEGIRLDAVKPQRLLVPSAKSLAGPVEAPDPVDHNVDHYTCYKVKAAEGAEEFREIKGVAIQEQLLGEARLFDLKKPTELCVPTDKAGEGLKQPEVHLLCYRAKRAHGEPKLPEVADIFINNQFGPLQVETVGGGDATLCVPSVKSGGEE